MLATKQGQGHSSIVIVLAAQPGRGPETELPVCAWEHGVFLELRCAFVLFCYFDFPLFEKNYIHGAPCLSFSFFFFSSFFFNIDLLGVGESHAIMH